MTSLSASSTRSWIAFALNPPKMTLLIAPPTNHRAKGGFHSRRVDHVRDQSNSFARSLQNRSGSFAASRENRSSRTQALPRNDAGGGYCSFSFSRLSIVALGTTIVRSPRTDARPADAAGRRFRVKRVMNHRDGVHD